jgi:uncharacterized protein DUF3489
MPSTKPLSKIQHLALETAADRPSGLLLPLPADLPARGAVRQRLLAGLLAAGFVEEVPAADPTEASRTNETGRGVALRITAQGLAAIGRARSVARRKARARPAPALREAPAEGSPPCARPVAAETGPGGSGSPGPDAAPAGRHPGGKLGRVLATLATEAGATLPELVALTGWQPHTTRAALTRLRQRGHALERHERDGKKAYRLGAAR